MGGFDLIAIEALIMVAGIAFITFAIGFVLGALIF